MIVFVCDKPINTAMAVCWINVLCCWLSRVSLYCDLPTWICISCLNLCCVSTVYNLLLPSSCCVFDFISVSLYFDWPTWICISFLNVVVCQWCLIWMCCVFDFISVSLYFDFPTWICISFSKWCCLSTKIVVQMAMITVHFHHKIGDGVRVHTNSNVKMDDGFLPHTFTHTGMTKLAMDVFNTRIRM